MAERKDAAAPVGTPAPEPGVVQTEFVAGDVYRIMVRGHELRVDQPKEAGGGDSGPTPVELFVASLAACVAFYAGRYLARHDLPREGLRVSAEFEMAADRPARVEAVRVRVRVPAELPAGRRAGLLAVARHCTVHNTLVSPPVVDIELGEAAPEG